MDNKVKKFIFPCIACFGLILTFCLVGLNLNLKGTRAIGALPAGIWEIPTSGYQSTTFPSGITEGNPRIYTLTFGGVIDGTLAAGYKAVKLFYEPNAQSEECPGVKYYVEFQNMSGEYEQILSIKGDGTIDPNCTHYKKFDYIYFNESQEVEDEFYIWFTKNFKRMVCAYNEDTGVYVWGASNNFSEEQIDTTLKNEVKCLEKNNRGVTFDIDGVMETKNCTLTSSGSCTINLPAKPTKSGYYFMGWAPNQNQCLTSSMITSDKTTMTIKDNATYVACFIAEQKETYSITFNANGGTGSMNPQTFEKGVSQKLNANQFTKTDYTFKGWSTTADGTGTKYKEQESISITENITLYAIWTKNINPSVVINNYKVNETDKTIFVSVGVNQTEFNQNITIETGFYPVIDSKKIDGKNVLYTGGKLKVYSTTGGLYKEYTIVVLGDTNGDGELSTMDYINVYNHLDNSTPLTGVYANSADMNSDDDITTMDYITIYNDLGGN